MKIIGREAEKYPNFGTSGSSRIAQKLISLEITGQLAGDLDGISFPKEGVSPNGMTMTDRSSGCDEIEKF